MPKTTKATAATATKPKTSGLKVERIFTKPGVHPYDDVKWESRDVVMTNWRDGSINFEQRGVEFPEFWSQNATQIVTSKYFRGAVGTPQRETGLKQVIDRVVRQYHLAGEKNGYFATAEDAQIFADELTWLLLHQYFSFNSPVWFNVGTQAPQQVSACFILSVDDTMESILDWYKEEGMIFKGGSGAGVNLSKIRSSAELLSSGGNASGPISFMRGADASAGTIKSGGATRRAAKMVILDVDHPDVEAFIDTKAREEDKIRALRDAGYDMDLGGEDMFSVQYQNANNSVRVTDEFMKAYEEGTDYALKGRLDGKELSRRDAREIFHKMAQAAWECADPGIQYDDIINDWHTNPNTDRIYASNPCFPADERVVTDKGLIKIGDLVRRSAEGETFAVFTNDVTAENDAADRVVATRPLRYMVTGTNEIVELRFSDGSRLRCTPNHRLWTQNRGWVHAEQLEPEDQVVRSNQYAPRSSASTRIPLAALAAAEQTGSALRLPSKWDEEPELAHYMGWLVGDGCVTEDRVVTVYGSEEEQRDLLPRHQRLLERLNGNLSKPSVQANGTHQLRAGKAGFAEFFKALGFSTGRSAEKVFPEAMHEADEETLVGFLQGLFDADGCAVELANGTRYVGLGSKSEELLIGVQETLSSLGISARIYRTESKDAKFQYTKKGGTEVEYASEGPFFDLRISGPSMVEFASLISFSLTAKRDKLASMLDFKTRYNTDRTVRMASRKSVGFETTYNLTEPRNHSYIVGGVVVANCSEYMSLDDSSCNLASLNLMKFLGEDGSFDVERFVATVEFVITAMEISISFADFPTEKIGQTTRDFRQLGIGYSNLGALLMASGHAYDSEDGRALAAAITSLMTGVSYRRSAEIAGVVGPYAGYELNAESHQRVMHKHADAADQVRTFGDVDATVLDAAKAEWFRGNEIGAVNGWRNAQASVLAPTGCLTGDTLITTDRGLTRLESLGDPFGGKWQDLDATVSTDEGPMKATKFFVNGEEPTRRITTEAGYRIQGTLVHRIKVVDEATGQWEWKRLAEVQAGDLVPMQLRQLVGEPNRVPLPVLDQAYYTEDGELTVPDSVSEELAELVGYFMGDGSLHAKGIRLCVAEDDQDVTDHLCRLSEKLFNLTPKLSQREGYIEVTLQSVRLARWWQAAGFAKGRPSEEHSGKGWKPRIPAAILETNAASVYEAFIRGLFEADGTVQEGVPSVCTCSPEFADEIRTLLLVLGFATTTRTTPTGWGGDASVVRIRNLDHALNFSERIGFIGGRKNELQAWEETERSGKRDRVHLPRAVWEEIVPVGHPYRNRVVNSLRKSGGVSRQTAADLYAHTRDERLRFAMGYLFERVEANEDGGIVPTYDLSVPENVTYVANCMVSHNTISFMMDCDTTGIEPDLALVKHKKLVGGGSMEIVNQTVPRALANLGYNEDQCSAIVDYIAEHGYVVGAPYLAGEHYSVFDCAMGERSISPMGHINMMAAVQPFLSGSVSKTVNLPETATVEDIEEVYFQGWKLGLKALAVYRDNCKVGQPLSAKKKEIEKAVEEAVEKVVETVAAHGPVRRKLPKKRPSQTISFSVGGAEGYMTSSSYPDDGLGEVFLKMSKQGSTLAGVMDALSVSISIALQYGVPLEKYVEKFTNMRFEPAGMTDDPDIRMASSLVDYIFRRLALDYLPYEERAAIGILTTAERTAELNGEDPSKVSQPEVDLDALRASAPIEEAAAEQPSKESGQIESKQSRKDILNSAQARSADAPLCMNCGTKMRPAGSCYACEGCGATSGCS